LGYLRTCGIYLDLNFERFGEEQVKVIGCVEGSGQDWDYSPGRASYINQDRY
jgi:hypothetical protein